MKNAIMKRIIATLGIAACSLSLVTAPALSVPVQAAAPSGEEAIAPCANIYEWVYAETTDNKLYKRLFNCSTGQWASDWIFVRDL